MVLHQKKLMLLGGLRYLLPVIEEAHKLGVHVITADYLPDNIAHKYSNEYCNVSIIDKEAVLKAAQELQIDGILSHAVDPGVVSAAYVAEKMGLPFVYVRPEPKKHGRQNQIEGYLQPGQTVVVIEDLISTGKSSLAAVQALRAAGAEVVGLVALFSYGFDAATKAFEEAGVPLITLSNYSALIELLIERGTISADKKESLEEWRSNPSTWRQNG